MLLIAVLFRTIEALKSFDLVMGMTGGGPGDQTELIAVNLYRQAFLGQFRTGDASALAYIILIIIIAVSNLYIRSLNQMQRRELSHGKFLRNRTSLSGDRVDPGR